MSLEPGMNVRHYVINRQIAKGGMGVVWDAWDTSEKKSVAVKAVANDLTFDPEFKMRMQDEARRHQSLEHPNIVSVLDVFESNGDTCIVMKLIEGTSLDHFLESKEHNRLEIREAIPIAGDILRALDYAHRHAIFHRDVKPSNVLLDKDNRALLIDFGIALAVGEDRRTRTGQTLGTPLYMSPEQITKPKEITYLSDVYSMGCVLYEMLTGRPPFVSGEDGIEHADFALQEAHVKIRPINPQIRVSTIPDNLDRLIMAALEKDPNERIGGCGEFLRLLEKGDGPPNDEPRPWPKFVWVFGLVILLLGLILVFFTINL